MRLIGYWLPVLLCMAFIFCASCVPGDGVPPLFPFQDISFHFFVYFALAYFFIRALQNTYPKIRPSAAFFLTVAFVTFYGLTDEFHQGFTAYRSVSGLDVFIDSLGGFTGGAFFLLIYGRNKALQGGYLQ